MNTHSGDAGGHGVWDCEAWIPIRIGVVYPGRPPLHRLSLGRKKSGDCACQLPKRLGGGVMKVDPSPSPRQAQGPQGSPVSRLTRLPVDLDVEVTLRPVLRPHRDRGGGKSWERRGAKRSGRGVRAEPAPQSPPAGLVRQRPRPRPAPSHPRPPGPHGARTHMQASSSPGWPPAWDAPRELRRNRCHHGRSPTPLTDHHPRPLARPSSATLNPARVVTNTARVWSWRRWVTEAGALTWACLGARRASSPGAPIPELALFCPAPFPPCTLESVAQSGSPGRACALYFLWSFLQGRVYVFADTARLCCFRSCETVARMRLLTCSKATELWFSFSQGVVMTLSR